MNSITEVIKRLDKATQQVMIETRFIEVTNTDATDIGINWTNLGGYNVRYAGEKQVGDAVGTELDPLFSSKVSDYSDTFDELGNLIRQNTVSRISSAVFSGDQFNVIVSALDQLDDSKLVSNPTVVTLNNQEAMISIGTQYPIPEYTYNEERGTFEVSGFEFKDIGVILRVKPSVNNSGLITLTVEPEVSDSKESVTFGGAGGASIPVISTRRTKTQISLKDGYTMGLGGLMETTISNNSSEVPVLGKIPLFGKLFRHKSEREVTRNLLIFITARILPSEDTDFEDVFSKDRIDDVGLDLDELRNQ